MLSKIKLGFYFHVWFYVCWFVFHLGRKRFLAEVFIFFGTTRLMKSEKPRGTKMLIVRIFE